MGAATAARTAALFPEVLSYIILEDVPWFDAESRARWARGRSQPQEPQPQTRDEWLAHIRAREPNWHEDELQTWADAKVQYHRRN